MSSTYWPWWAGGLALASIMIAYWLVLGRSMGVSGSIGRALRFRAERAAEASEASIASEEELAAALAEATRDAFGDEAVVEVETTPKAAQPRAQRRLPVTGEILFLAMLAVGGFLGALVRGGFSVRFDMGDAFARILGGGALGVAALVVGGVLVGFGTQFAGGCTSGHGLAGCARLERGSLLTTACFFGAAVAVSFALGAWS